MKTFEGQNVLVTGAAAGLGKSLALEFAADGARLAVIDRQDPASTVSDLAASASPPTAWCATSRMKTK